MKTAVTGAGIEERPSWRTVAIPNEHGGWGLTLEPVLLGLLLRPSAIGVLLGAGAFVAFLLRTPMKLVAIDLRHRRWTDRSMLAIRFAVLETLVLVAVATWVTLAVGRAWLVPVTIAAPFVGVEFWFDVRSRGRRLIPELFGSFGIASVSAAIVLVDTNRANLAVGVWLVLCARVVGAIPFVRAQIARLRGANKNIQQSDAAQFTAVAICAVAVKVEPQMIAGIFGLVILAALQLTWVRRPLVPVKVLGLRQMALGVGLVGLTALGAVVS